MATSGTDVDVTDYNEISWKNFCAARVPFKANFFLTAIHFTAQYIGRVLKSRKQTTYRGGGNTSEVIYKAALGQQYTNQAEPNCRVIFYDGGIAMIKHKVAEGVHFVGIMNPNLRVFDIIMKTEFGTSYNSYVVEGTEKTALVETAHARFFDQFIENINDVTDVSKLDYIILNHTEPDHSGSLARILEMNPNITVVASMAGIKYAEKITNMQFQSRIVKDGDTLDLGGKTLKFIIAPFLHWPDSMFTYLEEDKLLFSCDVFGCHYCEPRIFDKYVSYPQYYESAFYYYYAAIFGPFKEFVLKGLDKIKDLDIDIICPSHGPVITEGVQQVQDRYRALSEVKKNEVKKVLIVYVSAYGCTHMMADEIKKTLEESGTYEIEMMDAICHDLHTIKESIEKADALFIGSPTINRDALKPIWDVLSVTDAILNAGKPVGVFGSYGWSGEAVKMICERLRSLKLNVIGEGIRATFIPSPEELQAVRDYAKQMVEVLNK